MQGLWVPLDPGFGVRPVQHAGGLLRQAHGLNEPGDLVGGH